MNSNNILQALYSRLLDKDFSYNNYPTELVGKVSRKFMNQGLSEESILREIFDIQNDSFHDDFKSATGGKGNELRRILQIKSSALLSLLFFTSINNTKDNHITINGIKYTSAFFEVENRGHDGHNSSVDVVLVSEDKKKLLFLESKFIEPLCPSAIWVSMEYKSLYDDLFSDSTYLGFEPGKHTVKGKIVKALKFYSKEKHPAQYCGGIKQMLSHIIGLVKGPALEDSEYTNAFKEAEEIELATIVFGFDEKYIKEYSVENRYIHLYQKVFSDASNKIIIKAVRKFCNHKGAGKEISFCNHKGAGKEISISPKPLKYTEIWKDNDGLLENVKCFYKFGE